MTVWQSHQGLGTPPSQAHASEIPRMLIISLFTAVFPVSFIRYAYVFLMMLLGPIGVYLFIKYLLLQIKISHTNTSTVVSHEVQSISALLGALFYLLNVGTVQTFIAPLEMFVTKFGFIGFLFLFSTKFVYDSKRNDLIIFSIITLFASAMAHTATLWYVYFIGLTSYFFFLSLTNHSYIKRSFIIIIISLALNLFWILPNIYYSSNYYSDVINSKIHRLSSEETYFYNKKYGNVKDYLLLKNFLFDWKVVDSDQKYIPLLDAWEKHLSNPFVNSIAIIFSLMSFSGVLLAIRKKHTELISLIPLYLGVSVLLLSDIPGLFILFSWLRNGSPLIKEVLRSPFTKFSLYLIFLVSIFIGYFQYFILTFLARSFKKVHSFFFIHGYMYILIAIIFIYALPAFRGNFISPIERVRIPKEYFDLFAWSQTQSSERMLTFPINNMFGWTYYKWIYPNETQTYQGAGFTWFGLKQPSLNREFDRWYPYNEQNYREISYAVYSKNPILFQNLLEKYKIRYILFDKNIYSPDDSNDSKALFYPELDKLITSNGNIKQIKTFGNNITVFEYNLGNSEDIFVAKDIGPLYRSSYIDQGFMDNGEYLTKFTSETASIYPGRDIMNEKERVNNEILKINNDSYRVSLNDIPINGRVYIPPISAVEKESYINIYASTVNKKLRLRILFLIPHLYGNENTEQFVYLPSTTTTSFVINSREFVIPDGSLDKEVYLGEALIKFDNDNAIYFSDNNVIQKINLIPPNSTQDILTKQNNIDIIGNFPSEQVYPDIGSLVSEVHDCHSSKSEYINKKQIALGTDEYALNYIARNGTLCDTMSFPNLSHNQGYIVAIESKHVSGLPIKICFEDYVLRKCFINDELSLFKDYNTDYFIIPAYNDDINGYRLSVSNLSIGNSVTENNIKNIRIIPFPYGYFQSIYWSGENNESSLILTNNQAFEKNWKAYYIENGNNLNWIQKLFPFAFGKELTGHVLINNWSNGWIINGQESQNIVIVFMPQYLLIFGLIIILLVFLIVWSAKSYRKPNHHRVN